MEYNKHAAHVLSQHFSLGLLFQDSQTSKE